MTSKHVDFKRFSLYHLFLCCRAMQSIVFDPDVLVCPLSHCLPSLPLRLRILLPPLFHFLLFCLHLNVSIIFCAVSQNSQRMCEWSADTEGVEIYDRAMLYSWFFTGSFSDLLLWQGGSEGRRWGEGSRRAKASCSIMDWLLKYPEKYCLMGQAWQPRINPDAVRLLLFLTHSHSDENPHASFSNTPRVSHNATLCVFPVLDRNVLTVQDRATSFSSCIYSGLIAATPTRLSSSPFWNRSRPHYEDVFSCGYRDS